MGLHIMFGSSFDPKNPKRVGDEQRSRIKAKVELWTFLDENIEEILKTFLTDEELALEIIGTSIRLLHPQYEGKELIREVQLVLKALRIPVPKNYIGKFTTSFERIVFAKLKQRKKK